MKKVNLSGFLIILLSLFFVSFQNKNTKPLYKILDETVTDYDGNVYHTLKIGNQIWMLENLKVTRYRNGEPIPNIYNSTEWTRNTKGAYCMVDNDSVNYKNTYGLLYNYHAVINENNICPEGWRIPSEDDCLELINFLGGAEVAGKKLKANRPELWNVKNFQATDESGFAGLPAGGRGRLGEPGEVGNYSTWWSSTSYDSLYAWHWG